MKTERLRKRVHSARPVGRARLFNKKLVLNKRSMDGSGKANLEDSEGDEVWGVLYEINFSDIEKLDKVEKGYQRKTSWVKTDENKLVQAEIYVSTDYTLDARPFSWYKNLLISGAKEHNLPKDYINFLTTIPSKSNSH